MNLLQQLNKQYPATCLLLALTFLISTAWILRATPALPPTDQLDPRISGPLMRGVEERSNSWFSGLYHDFPTNPIFVLPGAYRFGPQGLALSFPQVVATPNTVFGSFDPICEVGNGESVDGIYLPRYGDWDVVVEARTTSGSKWRSQLIQGSPFVPLSGLMQGLVLECRDAVEIVAYQPGTWLVKRGEETIFFVQAELPTTGPDTERLYSGSGRFRIFYWPETTDQPLDFFRSLHWGEVLDTQFLLDPKQDRTSAALRLVPILDQERETLMTIWPHHRLAMAVPSKTLGQYKSTLGTLDLVQATELVLTPEVGAWPIAFQPVQDEAQREKIREALRADREYLLQTPPPAGVYFGGTWLGGVASLVLLAEAYQLEFEERAFLDILEQTLQERLALFRYDADKHMTVATNTEFGNEKGNDHHFHYGYYIRAAAVLVEARPELQREFEPLVNELIQDIATLDRTSQRFPFLRHFDVYAGHSWADGEARFADGNNQESSSEALNSWYALSLWYQALGDTERANKMQTLFTYELTGTRAYWFGEGNPFPKGYERSIASIVWGGKRDYATWFSGEAMHIHGIQWLPITPASEYLRKLPNFTERNQELLRAHPNPASHEWGDLYTAHLSYFEPQRAVELLPLAQQKRAMRSTALLLHTVYSNQELQRAAPELTQGKAGGSNR